MSRTRRRTRATRGGLLAALVGTLGLVACGDDPEAGPRFDDEVPLDRRYGGTVVLSGTTGVETFNPAAPSDDLSYALQRHVVLMTLLRPGEDLEPRPYLAEAWTINDDSTQVEFRLRRDVLWHDGRPTTARDVEFTFRRIKDPELGFPNAQWFTGWEGPEVVDEYTIRFAVRPHSGLLGGWTRMPILPRHLLGSADPAQLATHAFGAEPVGNGPYRFVERRGGDTWIFEANPDFPAALGGRPFLDRLVYRAIPEPATQLAELRTGGVHFVRAFSPAQLARARAERALEVTEYPTRAYGFIAWNGTRPLFQDARVRRALTMALDRQALIAAVRHGLGEVSNGPIGPWHPAHDAALAPLPFAPDSAAALLAAAGWSDGDGDGVRERNGVAFRFEILTNERDTYRDIAEIVQSRLRAVGVAATPRTVETSSLIDAITTPERRFDAFVLEWEPDFEIDDRQLFSCEAIGEAFQFSSYCDPALEPVLDSIPRARSPEDAVRLLRAYARAIYRAQPFGFLYFARDAAVYRRELRGVTLDIRGDLTSVARWWLHPAARDGGASEASEDDA